MLKKIALTTSILLSMTSGFASYTYSFTPINDSSLPLTLLSANANNNNIGVNYTKNEINFQIYDKKDGLPGTATVIIGRPDYSNYCILQIFSSLAGAEPISAQCGGEGNLALTTSWVNKGFGHYTIYIGPRDIALGGF